MHVVVFFANKNILPATACSTVTQDLISSVKPVSLAY